MSETMDRWHWLRHKWGPWSAPQEYKAKFRWETEWSDCSRQSRTCLTCGEIQVREIA